MANSKLGCVRCGLIILKAGVAYETENEGPMLESFKKDQEQPKTYWTVDNMMTFENIGFCKTVDGIKYLSCADCDLGPLGYHDTTKEPKLYHIASDRVKILE